MKNRQTKFSDELLESGFANMEGCLGFRRREQELGRANSTGWLLHSIFQQVTLFEVSAVHMMVRARGDQIALSAFSASDRRLIR
jgi:hypothetical protein